jgi:hypothetical protein
MKVFGANIRCATCDAQPFPDNPETTRETLDLLKVDDRWLCEQCREEEKIVTSDGVDA